MRLASDQYIDDVLTPHKLLLLFLVNLYTNQEIPNTRSISTFIGNQVLNSRIHNDHPPSARSSFQEFCYEMKIKIADKEAHLFCERALKEILSGINSIDEFLKAIARFHPSCLPSKTSVTQSQKLGLIFSRSVFGKFLQRQTVLIKLLSHSELVVFYDNFRSYLSNTYNLSDRNLFKTQEDNTTSLKDPSSNDSWHSFQNYPYNDLTILIDKETDFLEQLGGTLPIRIKLDYHSIALEFLGKTNSGSDSQTFALGHYIRYLEKLYDGDYHASFDSHHQYFDYLISRGSRRYFHLALISRAALHLVFGEDEKAIESIEEAIIIARESKDFTTLTFILTWLYDFLRKNPRLWALQKFYDKNDEHKLLNFLVERSKAVSSSFSAISHRLLAETQFNQGAESSLVLETIERGLFEALTDSPLPFIKICDFLATFWSHKGFPVLAYLYTNIGIKYCHLVGDKDGTCCFLLKRCDLNLRQGLNSEFNNDTRKISENNIEKLLCHKQAQLRQLLICQKRNFKSANLSASSNQTRMLEISAIQSEEEKTDVICTAAMLESDSGNHTLALQLVNERMNHCKNKAPDSSHIKLSVLKLTIVKSSILINTNSPIANLTFVAQQLVSCRSSGFVTLALEASLNLVKAMQKLEENGITFKMSMSILPEIHRVKNASLLSELYSSMARMIASQLALGELNDKLSQIRCDFHSFLKLLGLSITTSKKNENFRELAACFQLEKEFVQDVNRSNSKLKSSPAFRDLFKHSSNGTAYIVGKEQEEILSRILH